MRKVKFKKLSPKVEAVLNKMVQEFEDGQLAARHYELTQLVNWVECHRYVFGDDLSDLKYRAWCEQSKEKQMIINATTTKQAVRA